ncbi:2Fe-2S iron-sulfur cluster-binding protein [Aliivibrio fischeri]|uniref:2Fe-2S iron-sulfur cluster-binding protein n=1 Tax=Aliivibrio fischeri TaxID=668 RepID=UPI001F4837AB|nr:2Fe-2S iron-sulfur cluster-binding protein [Aliivibrio fischeri]MCE7577885.1 2Fe-2S iron-sulfur cluster-binding protein [Aliivibrio fischeri]MCE7590273.1 2Fe-2S iron-sulfur cluster-binding protein [Aliivibrio fischeri]
MKKITLLPQQKEFSIEEGQTILDAALEVGINYPNRCQVGACAMCLCKKLEGEIEYDLEPLLTDKEQQEGWVFACQATAKSDLVLLLE